MEKCINPGKNKGAEELAYACFSFFSHSSSLQLYNNQKRNYLRNKIKNFSFFTEVYSWFIGS